MRRQAREGKLVLPDLLVAEFVPAEVAPIPEPVAEARCVPAISVDLLNGDVTIRIDAGTSAKWIAEVFAAL